MPDQVSHGRRCRCAQKLTSSPRDGAFVATRCGHRRWGELVRHRHREVVLLLLRGRLRDGARGRRRSGDRAASGRQGLGRQGAPDQPRPAVHQGRDERGACSGRAAGWNARWSVPSAGRPWSHAPTSDAIQEAARRLRGVIDEHGPEAVAFYVSGQMSLEAQYLSNKLAKGFVGTNQIESNSRLCMASAGTGYKLSLGSDGPPGSYQDFDHADVFFVIGSNMADCHPILFLRMMDRVKAGAKLIVVDPRRTATADKADLFLQVKPGHRPGPAQRAPAPAGRGRPDRRGVHRGGHRGLGADARVPRGLPAVDRRRADGRRRGGPAHRGPVDRRVRRLDVAAGPWASTRAPTAPGTPTP